MLQVHQSNAGMDIISGQNGLSYSPRGESKHEKNTMNDEPAAPPSIHQGSSSLEDSSTSPGLLAEAGGPAANQKGLGQPSLGTHTRFTESLEESGKRLERLKGAVRTILECVEEDPDREGLLATPERYAKALMSLTKGYGENVLDTVHGAIFREDHHEMVIVKDIELHSLCEHHLLPFTGKMHIGYIPQSSIIGLSKLARIAEIFARRLQVQERLTRSVTWAVYEVLQPQGVAVIMESTHLCMGMRGVQKAGSTTVTSCMIGCFEERNEARNEFLNSINARR